MSRSLVHPARALLALICAAGLVAGFAAAAQAAVSTPRVTDGVASLNALRARVGVLPVRADAEMTADCRSHAAYYALTGHIGHEEIPGDSGYTASGDRGARSSNLAYGQGAFTGAGDWTPAVYHRIAMLHPRLATSGYWAENGIACLGVLGDVRGPSVSQLTAYPYPADGQQGLPVSFGCNERPDPCTVYPGASAKKPIGSILSLQFDGPADDIDATTVTSATLTADDADAPVVTTVQDSESGQIAPYLRGGTAVIPRRPLTPSTWYTARVTGTVASSDVETGVTEEPFDVTWRFQTAPVVLGVTAQSAAPRCSKTRKAKTRVSKRCKKAAKRR
ncbi:MAG: CAP domain-containing protein [Baekduia sp.]